MGDQEPRLVGTTIGNKYRVDAELGRGGMGAVYRVTHLQVHKEFALKILHERLTESREAGARFLKEAQAAGRIGHPAILDIYDLGETADGTQFMVMELLRGESLSTVLEAGALTVDQATWIATELLGALVAAHRVGIVHRDVKPQNVFLATGPDGRRVVKLLDFGIAKFLETSSESALTSTGKIIGSPLYMAPEQALATGPIDGRVDVWSIGATLFEMLAGGVAHSGSSPVAVLARILTEPAPKLSTRVPGIDPELDAIVERALKIERGERFESAEAMLEALLALRKKVGLGETPPPTFATRRITPPPSDSRRSDRSPASSMTLATRTTEDALLDVAVTKGGSARAGGSVPPAWLIPAMALAGFVLIAGATLLALRLRTNPDAVDPALEAASSAAPPVRPAAVAVEASVAAAPRIPAEASAPATADAAASAVPAAPPSAIPAARAARSTPSRNLCNGSEVLSAGHCCPRGFVWQKDRCERPLATSF
jgi:serine/threonine protein kinase